MTTTARQSDDATTANLEKEGAPCGECGKPLTAGQRYCLNCGHRRGEPRVEFEQHLFSREEGATANGARTAPAAAPRQWSPLAAVGVIALLAIMLLVGVLIGMEDDDGEQTATGTAPQGTTPTATAPAATPPAGTPPAATAPTTPPAAGTTPPAAPGAAEGAGGSGAGGQFAPAPEAEVPPTGGGNR
jgi:hypothetical protein